MEGALDLKQPAAVALFKELVRKADVVCENFSVGAMARPRRNAWPPWCRGHACT